jgi:hypothetical protein
VGLLGGSTLVVGALLGRWFTWPTRVIGLVMASIGWTGRITGKSTPPTIAARPGRVRSVL